MLMVHSRYRVYFYSRLFFCWNTPFFWPAKGGALPAPADKWLFLTIMFGAYAAALAISGRLASMPLCSRLPSVLAGWGAK